MSKDLKDDKSIDKIDLEDIDEMMTQIYRIPRKIRNPISRTRKRSRKKRTGKDTRFLRKIRTRRSSRVLQSL